MNASFDFLKYTINKMEYNVLQEEKKAAADVHTNASVQQNLEDPSVFRLTITVCAEGDRHIFLEVFGFFKWRGEYIQGETETAILTFGTTILYPYARSAISSISIMDGGDPLIIPTINPFNAEKTTEESAGIEDHIPAESHI